MRQLANTYRDTHLCMICYITAKVSHAWPYLQEREGGRRTDGEVETLVVPSHEKKSLVYYVKMRKDSSWSTFWRAQCKIAHITKMGENHYRFYIPYFQPMGRGWPYTLAILPIQLEHVFRNCCSCFLSYTGQQSLHKRQQNTPSNNIQAHIQYINMHGKLHCLELIICKSHCFYHTEVLLSAFCL